MDPYRLIELGIAHVPEARRLFVEMTVEENLDMGSLKRRSEGSTGKDKGNGIRAIAKAERTKETTGWNPKRWRTADACHRKGIDVFAQTSDV